METLKGQVSATPNGTSMNSTLIKTTQTLTIKFDEKVIATVNTYNIQFIIQLYLELIW